MFTEQRQPPSGTPTSQTNYLPAFLLGGGASPSFVSPTLSSTQHSPARQNRLLNISQQLPAKIDTLSATSVAPLIKQSGPPVASLYESQLSSPYTALERRKLFQESCTNPNLTTQTTLLGANTSLDQSVTLNLSAGLNSLPGSNSLLSPAQVDPFYTQGEDLTPEDKLDQCWVTVFGFPPNSISFILDQFSQYGTILHHVTVPGANWLHLKYHTLLQAKKALSKNGKVFGSSIMVGVQQCIDKALMTSSPNETSTIRGGTPMRPLTSSYKVPVGDNALSDANTPQKNTGILAKTMEYVFGW